MSNAQWAATVVLAAALWGMGLCVVLIEFAMEWVKTKRRRRS